MENSGEISVGMDIQPIHKQRNKQRNKEIISHSINPVQCFRSLIESKNVVFLSLGNIKLVFQRSGRQAVNPNPPAPPLSEDLCGTRPAFGELLSPWALFSGVGGVSDFLGRQQI